MAGELQRHGDVFQRRHVGDQVEGLEDDADIAAAERGDLVLGLAVQQLAGDADRARIDPFQAGDHHQQRRFAGPGRADDAGRLAACDVEADPLQDMHQRGALAEGQRHVLQRNDGFCHGKSALYWHEDCAWSVTYGLVSMAFKLSPTRFSGRWFAASFRRGATAEPYRIVGFGDSLMAGFGLNAGEGFTEKLQAALKAEGHDVEVINAGVSGDTTSGGLSRLDWSVPDGTQLVILELGANDMLRAVAPDITEKNLDAMLAQLKERKIPVLLAGMRAAPNLGADYQAAFDAIYPRLAEKYGVPLYPFFLDGVGRRLRS